MSSTALNHSSYVIKRKLFTLLSQKYRIFDPQGNMVFFAKMKAFKLKEDLRLFHDEAMTQEVIAIKARRIVDFGAAYDIFDPVSQQRLGTLRRKGIRSMVRDQWAILNFDDQEIGTIEEDSWALALVRRFVWSLLPQNYHITVKGHQIATVKRHISFIAMKISLTILPAAAEKIDTRVLLAATLLLSAVEGGQG